MPLQLLSERIRKSVFRVSLILLLLLIEGTLIQAQSTEAQPNFLFIIADDLNDYPGFAGGHPQAVSPNLDELARDGVRFDNAFCNSPVCASSRASFLSGKHPVYTQVYNNTLGFPWERVFRNKFRPELNNETVFTIPEILKDSAGYYTIGINKIFHGWFSTGHDNDYDTVSTTLNCNRQLSWNEFFDFHPETDVIPVGGPNFHEGVPGFPYGMLPDSSEKDMIDYRVADSAIAFLNRYAKNPARYCNKPYFLAVGFRRPHGPNYVPEKYFLPFYEQDLYRTPYPIPYNEDKVSPPSRLVMPPQPDPIWSDYDSLPPTGQAVALADDVQSRFNDFYDGMSPAPEIAPGLDNTQRRRTVGQSKQAGAVMAYLASLSFVDAQIGRIVEALETYPELLDNTVIVFISDHGFSLGEKKHWGKFTPWETEMRIPMFIHDPRQSGGQRVSAPVSLLDLFPTFLDLAGSPHPSFPDGSRYLDGESLAPLIRGGAFYGGQPVLLSQQASDEYPDITCFLQHAVRDEQYRYIRWRDDVTDCVEGTEDIQEELYRLGTDREFDAPEWNNLLPAEGQFVRDQLDDYLPDGALFGLDYLPVTIGADSLPCLLSDLDSIHLTAGTPSTNPIQYSWTVEGTSLEGGSSSFSFATAVASEGAMRIHVLAEDTLANRAGSSMLTLFKGAAPDPTFSVVRVANRTVAIEDFEAGSPYQLAHWDFGDGYIWTGSSYPPEHRYSAPGIYEVSLTVEYGNNPGQRCELMSSQAVNIPESQFDMDDCPTPTAGWSSETGHGENILHWTEGWNHQSWELRWQPVRLPLEGWQRKRTDALNHPLEGLEQNRSYQWQVRAVCSEEVKSDWSAEFRFTTERCPRPAKLEALAVSRQDATLDWAVEPRANEGYLLRWQNTTDSFQAVSQLSSLEIENLEPWRRYSASVQSRCAEPSGSVYLSDPRDGIYFITVGKLIEEESLQLPEQNDIAVQPNPTGADQIRMVLEMGTEGSGVLQIFDVSGRLMQQDLIQWSAGSTSRSISLPGATPGLYLIGIDSWTGLRPFYIEPQTP